MYSLNIDNKLARSPEPGDISLQSAILASLVALATSFLIRFAFGGPLVPEILADFIFSVMPISVIEAGVSLLGPFAKQLGFIGCVVIYFLALSISAELALGVVDRRRMVRTLSLALCEWAVTVVAIFPALGAGFGGRLTRHGTVSALVSMLVVYLLHAGSLDFFSAFYSRNPIAEQQAGADDHGLAARARGLLISRRRLMKWVGYSVIAVAAYDIARAVVTPILQAGAGRVKHGTGRFPDITGLALEITPTPDFYEVSKNPSDPDVDVRRWKLEIGGRVNSPFTFGYEEIMALPYVEEYATLECISNEVGGSLISNALWRGVRLKQLLQRAGLSRDVAKIVFHAVEGYTDSIPVVRALQDGTILAYLINGVPLPQSHGFPLRLIVPGIYGMKNVKWITKIEAVNYDYKGYWQRRGWDDVAEYKAMSRIDAPDSSVQGPTTIAGIAFAGDRGIARVEVSTDGGKVWEQAEVKPALSPYTWVLWHKDWNPSEGKGTRQLVVRATDGRGETQTPVVATPIPDGASGYDRRTVDVK